MIERKTVSQCSSAAYCCGWNDAAAADFERFHMLREKTFVGIGKALSENGGYGKSYEGAFEIIQEYSCFYDDVEAIRMPIVRIRLHCYVLGPARHYEWPGRTFEEALAKAEADIDKWIAEPPEEEA